MSLLNSDTQLNRDSYYEATVQRPPACPPLADALRVDVAVVGGGLAGLSAAIELALRGTRVALLEADVVGGGASGRNGGQALVGFASGQSELKRQLGQTGAQAAWDMSIEAVQLMKTRLQDAHIDADWQSGALTVATGPRKAKALAEEFEHMSACGGVMPQWLEGDALRAHVNSDAYCAGIYETTSGHLHPLKYTLGLLAYAQSLGVQVFEHTVVKGITPGQPMQLHCGEQRVRADAVVLAGNCSLPSWSPQLAPSIHARIMPVGTYIIATPPLPAGQAQALMASRAAICDNNFVLDYYRLAADDSLLFGGRVSYTTRTPRHLAEKMHQRMATIFPSLRGLPVRHVWGGFVDISMNRAPDFGRVSPQVYYLQGFSGHGLALTGLAGRVVAEALQGDNARWDCFARLRHQNFPGGARWRTPVLAAGMAWHRLSDWWS